MHPVRRKRLFTVLFALLGLGVTLTLVLVALNENLNLFYTPEQVVTGEAPVGVRIRAGGVVEDGTVQRIDSGLDVEFMVGDMAGSTFKVVYSGILPALFREGQGVITTGRLDENRVFRAEEVLARHDETYIPVELMEMHVNAKAAQAAEQAKEAAYMHGHRPLPSDYPDSSYQSPGQSALTTEATP